MDRWIVLAATERDLPRFRLVETLETFEAVPAGERLDVLTAAIAAAPAATWIDRFRRADIGASICDNIDAIRSSTARAADGTPGTDRGSYAFSVYADHPSGHVVTHLDPYAVRPATGEISARQPAEKYGASTRQVVRSLGYSEAEIDDLVARGTISETWSREYLPS